MSRSSGPVELFGISSGAIGILSWLAPDWPLAVKIAVCVILLAPIAVHWMLPHDGKGLRLLLFAVWGAIQGAVVGSVVAWAYFSEPVYEVIALEGFENGPLGPTLTSSFPTGEEKLTPYGWMVAAAGAGLGAVIGLYVRYRQMAEAGDERLLRNRLVFAALGLVAMVGAGTAAYGYKYRELSEDRVAKAHDLIEEVKRSQDPKNRQPPPPGSVAELLGPDTSSASMVLANDALKAAERAEYVSTRMFYIGLGVTGAAALAAVLYAAYVIRLRHPSPKT